MNTTQLPWLWIIGIGDDGLQGISADAKRLIDAADVLVGGKRHLSFISPKPGREHVNWPSPWSMMLEELRQNRDAGRNVCVLASGDPFWHGVGGLIAKNFQRFEWVCMPHTSAFQLAAQHMGWSVQDCQTISLHGRPTSDICAHLGKGGQVLSLAESGTAAELSELLYDKGFENIETHCLEHLGSDQENAFVYQAGHTADLVTLAFDLGPARLTGPLSGLPDEAYEHDGQMTKQEVRAITMAKLAPQPGELLWDLGAGSGSIAIEWCRLQPTANAIAIERNLARIQRIKRNARALAAYNLKTLRQSVDEPIESATPSAVFIGGGLTADLMSRCWDKLPSGGRLVANAVTLESEALLAAFPGKVGLEPAGHLSRISTERPTQVGDKFGWKPAMTVTQLAITKP